MSKKKKKNSDTREFTALKNVGRDKPKQDQPAEKMVFSDRAPKPGFEL